MRILKFRAWNKREEKRDTNIILNAIKLQAELQEKKLLLMKSYGVSGKIDKGYLYERDEEIWRI